MAKPNPTFRAVIERVDGKNRPRMGNPARYHDYIHSLRVGKTVWITIEAKESKRTLSQNALYWLYLNVIADETGDDSNSLHEFFRRKLLSPKFLRVQKEVIKIPRSTTELSKAEFAEYLDRVCALTSIPIPNPQDAGYLPH